MAIETIRPGAKPGQVILGVDLAIAGNDAIALLKKEGYEPEIKELRLAWKTHLFAVLKDIQMDSIPDDFLLKEWAELKEKFTPDSVRLWRGLPSNL